MENTNLWSHTTFRRYFERSPILAFQYRKDCLGVEIPEEYRKQVKEEAKEEAKEEVKKEVKKDYKRQDLTDLLNKSGIKYTGNSKDETLLKKCLENNLL